MRWYCRQRYDAAGDKLLMYCAGAKAAEVALKYSFQAGKWYHIAVAHSAGGPLSASSVSLFVDGELRHSTRFKYPKVLLLTILSALLLNVIFLYVYCRNCGEAFSCLC